jgi:hypothetical protein
MEMQLERGKRERAIELARRLVVIANNPAASSPSTKVHELIKRARELAS